MYHTVKKVIDGLDLYGFFKMGAPSDEYDSESREISLRINVDSSADEIAFIISDVFTKSFSQDWPPECFIEGARKIKAMLCLDQSK